MKLHDILEACGIGDIFYRQSSPNIIYDRIGTLIEKNGRGWARLVRHGRNCRWTIAEEMQNKEDETAADWVLEKGKCYKEYDESKQQRKKRKSIWEIDIFENLMK